VPKDTNHKGPSQSRHVSFSQIPFFVKIWLNILAFFWNQWSNWTLTGLLNEKKKKRKTHSSPSPPLYKNIISFHIFWI
jgi:hypothetical protein